MSVHKSLRALCLLTVFSLLLLGLIVPIYRFYRDHSVTSSLP